MPLERASVFDTCQLGAESLALPGTQVNAAKRLEALGFMLRPRIETSRYRPYGVKYDTLMIPGKDWSEARVSGKLDFANIVYALASILGSPVITTPGGGTNSRDWTFSSNGLAPDACQTYTIESGSAVRAQRVLNALFTEFGISFKRDGADVSGSLIGKLFTDNVYLYGNEVQQVAITGGPTGGTFTLTFSAANTSPIAYNATAAAVQAALGALSTIGHGNVYCIGGPLPSTPVVVIFTGAKGGQNLTAMTANSGGLTGGTTPTATITTPQEGAAVTAVAAVPITPGNVNVYVDASSGALGGTKLTRVLQADLRIANRHKNLWTLNSSETSWAATYETAPDVTLKLKMEADGAGMGFLTTLRNMTTQFVRIEVDSGTNYIEGSIPHKFRWDMATKFEAPDEFGDTDGLVAIDYTLRGVYDSTWGKLCNVVCTNTLTAL